MTGLKSGLFGGHRSEGIKAGLNQGFIQACFGEEFLPHQKTWNFPQEFLP